MFWLLIGILTFSYLHKNYQVSIQQAQNSLDTDIEYLGLQVSQEFEAIRKIILNIRKDIKYFNPQELQKNFELINSSVPSIRTLSLMNAQGEVVASSRLFLLGKKFDYRDYFKYAKTLFEENRQEFYLSTPFKTILDIYTSTISIALGKDNHFSYVIVATLDPLYFYKNTIEFLKTKDILFQFKHSSGAEIFSTYPNHLISSQNENRDTQDFKVLSHNDLISSTFDIKLQWLENNYSIQLLQPKSKILSSWYKTSLQLISVFITTLIFSAAILFYFQKNRKKQDLLIKQFYQNLIHQNTRLKTATSAANLGAWELNLKEGTLSWDEKMHQIYGSSEQEFTGHYDTWRRYVHPDDVSRIENLIEEALIKKRGFQSQFRIINKNKETHHIRVAANCLFSTNGNLLSLVGINEDISLIKESQLKKEEAEATLQATFDCAAVGMGIVNLEGRFLRVNQALCDFFGFNEENLLKQTLESLTYAEDLLQDQDLRSKRAFLNQRINQYTTEKRYYHKAGHLVWGLTSFVNIANQNTGIRYFIVQISDITQHKKDLIFLQEQKALFDEVISKLPASIIYVDTNLYCQNYNTSAKKLFAHTLTEGTHLYQVCKDLYACQDEIKLALNGHHSTTNLLLHQQKFDIHFIPYQSEGSFKGLAMIISELP
ncbi:PAS domain S-box-containing protein [Allopseudospirillum japonicum]|uniref:histidine kinase n=1 Tax=Allopseudospirillum japonicum TaxID=64971 RepID=A0A1H6Q0F3_9GAMM|nr:PAS domain S-box-containing protein [Allopseudospirillum japonicum]